VYQRFDSDWVPAYARRRAVSEVAEEGIELSELVGKITSAHVSITSEIHRMFFDTLSSESVGDAVETTLMSVFRTAVRSSRDSAFV